MDVTVSPRKLKANRANAQHSTGPKTAAGKLNASRNSLKHGLLTRRLVFDNPTEEAEFNHLLEEIALSTGAGGGLERLTVEEIATCYWRLAQVERLLQREMRADNQNNCQSALETIARGYETFRPLLALFENNGSLPFDFNSLNLRITMGKTDKSDELQGHKENKSGEERQEQAWRSVPSSTANSNSEKSQKNAGHQVEHELELAMSLSNRVANLMRYAASIRRDLYRAMKYLDHLREQRWGQAVSGPGTSPAK
jgi:hypothetical protein